MTPVDVVKFAEENNCQMVDYKFLDFISLFLFKLPIAFFEVTQKQPIRYRQNHDKSQPYVNP